MKVYNGNFASRAISKTRTIDTGVNGRKLRSKYELDGLTQVTVMGVMSKQKADEKNDVRASTTLAVALNSPKQIRRITGFDSLPNNGNKSTMATELAQLNIGDVITVYGRPLRSDNGINGFDVEPGELYIIEKATAQPDESTEALEANEQGQEIHMENIV
jgi:hypothetical protein